MFGILARRSDRLGYVGGGGFGNDAQTGTGAGMRRIEHALCLQQGVHELVTVREPRRRERVDQRIGFGGREAQEPIGAVHLERRIRIVQVEAYRCGVVGEDENLERVEHALLLDTKQHRELGNRDDFLALELGHDGEEKLPILHRVPPGQRVGTIRAR